MTTIPTPAEFLASIEPDEDLDQPPHAIDHPLYLIAQSLQRMADAHGAPVPAVLDTAACTECERSRAEAIDLANVYDEAGSRAEVAEALIVEIEGIVKKSTSQVSLAVKAAIEAWRNPAEQGDPVEPVRTAAETNGGYTSGPSLPSVHVMLGGKPPARSETPSPAQDAPAVDEAAAGPLVQAPELDVPQASAGEGLSQPATDADVSEWRTYARYLGHGRTGPAFNELEAMNRSQIRTLLGIEQPVASAGA